MRHLLSRRLSICGRQRDPLAPGKLRLQSGCHLPNQLEHRDGFFRTKITEGRNMPPRHHQHMPPIDRADVEKSERQIILSNPGRT
nr:hypothetical protein [Luteolibacter luteus]